MSTFSRALLKFPIYAALALLLATPAVTSAQTTQQEIEARLKGHPLYLRGQWAPNKLQFDLTGTTSSPAISAPFTLSGIDVQKVNLAGNYLEVDGDRVGLEFEKDTPKRVSLHTPIQIKIAGGPGADYGPALDRIFADDLSALVPAMPFYWQHYAQAHLLAHASAPTAATTVAQAPPIVGIDGPQAISAAASADQHPTADLAGEPLRKIGGGVSAPTIIYQVEPQFSDQARAAKFNGLVTVQLILNAQGVPENVHVIRGVGMGLDENAVEAVRQYRFQPAKENGNPVPVLLNVEVNFQFFRSSKATTSTGIQPPQVIKSANPVFPDAVKNLGYPARSTVHIIVKVDGTAGDPYIVQAAGLGLDEEALRAVAQYRFKPATQNGKPVPVQLNIEVNFQIGN
jgi:TonB family protein